MTALTLAADIDNAVTTVTTSVTTGKHVGDYLVLGEEALLIEGFGTKNASSTDLAPIWSQVVDPTTIFVKRGQLGTTPAAHSSGAAIGFAAPAYTGRTSAPLIAGGVIAAGSAYTVTAADDGKTILLDNSTASVVTLPAASGSGARFRFIVKTIGSGSHKVQVASASDILQGIVNIIDSDTAGTTTGFATASDSDTVTLNHGTTGGVIKGEWLEVEDIASGIFAIRGQLANTSNGATPFSAAVS